jgi:hypothetical protein
MLARLDAYLVEVGSGVRREIGGLADQPRLLGFGAPK